MVMLSKKVSFAKDIDASRGTPTPPTAPPARVMPNPGVGRLEEVGVGNGLDTDIARAVHECSSHG